MSLKSRYEEDSRASGHMSQQKLRKLAHGCLHLRPAAPPHRCVRAASVYCRRSCWAPGDIQRSCEGYLLTAHDRTVRSQLLRSTLAMPRVLNLGNSLLKITNAFCISSGVIKAGGAAQLAFAARRTCLGHAKSKFCVGSKFHAIPV